MTNPLCNCGAATENIIQYLLRCLLYSVQRTELLNGVYKLDSTLQNSSENQLLAILLHRSETFASNVNKEIIRLTISYLKASEHFVQPYFWSTILVFLFSFFFLFIHLLFLYVLLYKAYCKWLYLTWVLCLVSSTVLRYYFSYLLCYCQFYS